MSDLQQLIEAVERGEGHNVELFAKRLASSARDRAESFPSYDVEKAFRGSLDAAKSLHEALLPGWDASISFGPIQGMAGFAMVMGWHIGKAEAEADNPARAWLLAILWAFATIRKEIK